MDYLNTINDTIPNTRRAALLAAEIHESSLDPRAVGDGGKALGLLQVHPNRRTALYNKKGTDKEMINNQSTAIVDALSGRDPNRDHWTHGGKGSGFNSWKEAQKTFYNNNSSLEEVNRALNRGFIRPHDAAVKTKERLKRDKVQMIDKLDFNKATLVTDNISIIKEKDYTNAKRI